MPNGSHSFYAKAYDAAGNSTTSAANTVTVNNAVQTAGPWAIRLGGSSTDYGSAQAVDGSGNIIVAGVFTATVDFSNGSNPSQGTLSSSGPFDYDVFVAKYSSSGAYLWAKRFGSSTASEVPKCMALDSSGNIFVGGTFLGGSVMKLDSSGNLQWTKGPVVTGNNQIGINSIATDSQGSLLVTGMFNTPQNPNNPMDFGDGHVLLSSAGSDDAFLAKYAADGTCLFAKDFFNYGGREYGTGVAVDKRINPGTGQPYDNILVTGYSFSGLDLGGGLLLNGISTGTAAYGFLGLFNTSGGHLWSRTFGTQTVTDPSGSFARPSAMTLDSSGNIVVSGLWNSAANFGGGTRSGWAPNWLMFVAKYAVTDGHWIWDTEIAGNLDISPASVTADAQNNVIVAGSFHGTVNVGAQSITTGFNYAPSPSDCFVVKYSSAGSPAWVKSFGGPGDDGANGVSVDSSGSPVVTGGFNGSATFGSQSLTSAGGVDCFLMRLSP